MATARQLAHVHQRRPRQADLRRSISTSYHALFQGLVELAASRLVGSTSAAQKSASWSRVYRNLNYLTAKTTCSRPELQACSEEPPRFLMAFPRLQELRHQADDNPTVRLKQREALNPDDDAERVLAGLQATPREQQIDRITLALGMTRS